MLILGSTWWIWYCRLNSLSWMFGIGQPAMFGCSLMAFTWLFTCFDVEIFWSRRRLDVWGAIGGSLWAIGWRAQGKTDLDSWRFETSFCLLFVFLVKMVQALGLKSGQASWKLGEFHQTFPKMTSLALLSRDSAAVLWTQRVTQKHAHLADAGRCHLGHNVWGDEVPLEEPAAQIWHVFDTLLVAGHMVDHGVLPPPFLFDRMQAESRVFLRERRTQWQLGLGDRLWGCDHHSFMVTAALGKVLVYSKLAFQCCDDGILPALPWSSQLRTWRHCLGSP